MSKEAIIRAWKNEEYRGTLSATEQSALPLNPAGLVELDDSDLGAAGGSTFLIACDTSLDLNCDCTILLGTCKLWTNGCCKALPDNA